MGSKISWQWRNTLKALARYDHGIDEDAFIAIMSEGETSRITNPTKAALRQMYFLDEPYYKKRKGKLFITAAGREAIKDE